MPGFVRPSGPRQPFQLPQFPLPQIPIPEIPLPTGISPDWMEDLLEKGKTKVTPGPMLPGAAFDAALTLDADEFWRYIRGQGPKPPTAGSPTPSPWD